MLRSHCTFALIFKGISLGLYIDCTIMVHINM